MQRKTEQCPQAATYRRISLLIAVLSSWLVIPGCVRAEPDTGAQFVFVIDDSRSMSQATDGFPAADPDRLAIFAVRSLVTMLDEEDEVSVVRLNGAVEGDEPLALNPLALNRAPLEELLSDGAPLAGYRGRFTPCQSALDRVGRLLDEAHRPGVAQVVLLLTDGQCNQGSVDPGAFLASLKSHQEELFQFYLLHFRGRPSNSVLADLAELSGGQAIEVGGEDPTSLLEPFADALSRSQGYEADVLTPRRMRLAPHFGARRMRLLAVAGGEGPALGFDLRERLGGIPRGAEAAPRTGTHRYGSGEIYRFAALDYLPGRSEVDVRVTGAGDGWKVVAVPEYRLYVRMVNHRGTCADPGEALDQTVDVGQSVCTAISLVDETGRVISGRLVERLDATLRVGRQDLSSYEAKVFHANHRGDRAEFVFEHAPLPRGVWSLKPTMRLRLSSDRRTRVLPSRYQTLQAVTVNVSVDPREIDFGALVPGDITVGEVLRFAGEFPATRGRLEVIDRSTVPTCVQFVLGDAPEGKAVPIVSGQGHSLSLRVAPYCGPESFDRQFVAQLRIALDRSQGRDLPGQSITVRWGLDYRLEVPETLVMSLRAGESGHLEVPLGGNWTRPQDFETTVTDGTSGAGLPAQLTVRPKASDEGTHRLDTGDVAGNPLRLKIAATPCCSAGTYETYLQLKPVADSTGFAMASAVPPRPIEIPIRVEVEGAGLWACRGSLIFKGLLWAGLVLLLLFVASMFRNSVFLSREHLAASLVPLRWDPYGTAVRHGRVQEEVLAVVRRGMPLTRRILAWLRANPLIFGLPGRKYRETIELWLQPERRIDRSRLELVAQREHLESLQNASPVGGGRLFARASGGRGQLFYALPKPRGVLGRLVPEQLVDAFLHGDDEREELSAKPKVLRLRKRQRLIHAIPEREREEGRAAGWQLG